MKRRTCCAAAVSLAHANQLPLPRLRSASGHESDSCKQRNSKYRTFTVKVFLCLIGSAVCARCVAVHFGGSGGANGSNNVMVDDAGFKSSCAVGQQSAVPDGVVGGPATAGLAMTSFYDAAPTSSSCDVTQSNGMTSSFGFTQEQVACVCEVRAK